MSEPVESDAEQFKALITGEAFRRELHHLLWIPPLMNRGQRDLGWNCREHAMFVGVLAMLRGLPAVVLRGRAGFVQGSAGGRPPGGLSIDPHWWLRIEQVGSCDLSPRLDALPNGTQWTGWESSALVGGKFLPAGSTDYSSVGNPAGFEQAFNAATHQSDQRAAIYNPREFEHLGANQVERAMKWCDSPLTVQLKKLLPGRGDVYAKAILFLDELLRGETESLTGGLPIHSWRRISARPGNGRVELLARLNEVGIREANPAAMRSPSTVTPGGMA